jgi:hypothetical protein
VLTTFTCSLPLASCLLPPTTTHELQAQVGGFHIFHREDLRAIAPKWLGYTRKVRAFANAHPEEYFNESIRHDPKLTRDEVAVLRKQARWHGEMYGYVFAAAEVGATHTNPNPNPNPDPNPSPNPDPNPNPDY